MNTSPAEIAELRVLIHRAIRSNTVVLASCYAKRVFAGPLEAIKAIRHPGIGSYRCQHCGHWHIGSQNHRAQLGGKLRTK